MTNAALLAEIEQNANFIHEYVRKEVADMNPSVSAVTMAFGALYKEALYLFITSDWSDGKRQLYSDLIEKLVIGRLDETFQTLVKDCEELANPMLPADVQLFDSYGDDVKH